MKNITFLFVLFFLSTLCKEVEVKKKDRFFRDKCYVYIEEKEYSRIHFILNQDRVIWSSDWLHVYYDIQDIVSEDDFIYQVDDCSFKKYNRFILEKNKPPLAPVYLLILLRNRNEILRYIRKIYVKNANGKKQVIDTSLLPDTEYADTRKK